LATLKKIDPNLKMVFFGIVKKRERERFYIKENTFHAKKGRSSLLAHTTMLEKIRQL